MQHIILFDSEVDFANLLPITFTRPISNLRVGILTIKQKWERRLPGNYCLKTAEFLNPVFPCEYDDCQPALHICSSVLPNEDIVNAVRNLKTNETLLSDNGEVLAFYGCESDFKQGGFKTIIYNKEYRSLKYVFDIFLNNGEEIKADFSLITKDRQSAPLPTSNILLGDKKDALGNPMIFIEEGAEIEASIINLKYGPVYIGKNARVMEGSHIRGPFALCDNAQVRMGAKIYSATTLGPYCKAGGELSNVVMLGYSNKSHDGYLGNAVIGEWCNIGAGVNASNLKNDYSKIRIWNYTQRRFIRTDLQFCGLIMGDHSKAGVNCMFNTATVLGVGVNVHGAGFPRVFVPSFSEGSATSGFSDVSLEKFFEIADRVMSRRGHVISEKERKVYEHVYNQSQTHK